VPRSPLGNGAAASTADGSPALLVCRSPRASITSEKDRLTRPQRRRAHRGIRSLFAPSAADHKRRGLLGLGCRYVPGLLNAYEKCSPRSRSRRREPRLALACHGESDAALSRGEVTALGTMSEHDAKRGLSQFVSGSRRPRRPPPVFPLPLVSAIGKGRPHAGDCPARARVEAGFVGEDALSWRRSRPT